MDQNFGFGTTKAKKGNVLEDYTSSEEEDDIEDVQKLDMLKDRQVLGDEEEDEEAVDDPQNNQVTKGEDEAQGTPQGQE